MSKPHHLLGCLGCGSAIVETLLNLAKIKYMYEEVDYGDGSPTRQRLLDVNPLGQVPSLVLPDGTVMTESLAIAFHVNDLRPEAGLVPPPDHPDRAKYLRWQVFLIAAVYPTFTYGDDTSRWVDNDESAGKLLRASTDDHRKRTMKWLNDAAEQDGTRGPWFLGDTFSTLDVYVAMMTYWRPGKKWYEKNCPKLIAIAKKAEENPVIAEMVKRNFS
jgi:GST-like protein